jgi:hypothetical protein
MLVLAMDQMIENDCGDSDMLSGCNRLYNWLLKHGCDREEGLEDW